MTVFLHAGDVYIVRPKSAVIFAHEQIQFVAYSHATGEGREAHVFAPNDRSAVQVIPNRCVQKIEP